MIYQKTEFQLVVKKSVLPNLVNVPYSHEFLYITHYLGNKDYEFARVILLGFGICFIKKSNYWNYIDTIVHFVDGESMIQFQMKYL